MRTAFTSSSFHAQFFNEYATTTSGQAFIAAVNKLLSVASEFFLQFPIEGEVLKVDDQDIYINIGDAAVVPREKLELLYFDDPAIPAYAVSQLEVEEVFESAAIVHALDIKTANVKAGDSVRLKRKVLNRTITSAAGSKVKCMTTTFAQSSDESDKTKADTSHWTWRETVE